MKKLALLLALIMVLSVAVLASCGKTGEESKPEESAVESKAEESKETESKAEESKEESKAEESVEESKEEESEPEESKAEESAEPVQVNGENIALNKSYTISGCGNGYADGAGTVYQAPLTDGNAIDQLTYGDSNNWFGFYSSEKASPDKISAPGSVGTVVIDLGEAKQFGRIRVHLYAAGGTSGIGTPKSIEVDVSEDGSNYNELGAKQIDASATGAIWVEIDGSANARYVRVTINMDPTCVFMFLNEIEVIA